MYDRLTFSAKYWTLLVLSSGYLITNWIWIKIFLYLIYDVPVALEAQIEGVKKDTTQQKKLYLRRALLHMVPKYDMNLLFVNIRWPFKKCGDFFRRPSRIFTF